MRPNCRTSYAVLLAVLYLCVSAALSQVGHQIADKGGKSESVPSAGATAASVPSSDASKYVGAETCKTCHEEIYSTWEKTPHWKTTLNTKGGPSKQGCEGCHGPGADHVAGGGDKTKIFVFEGKSRQETSARCLSCHGEAHEQSHFAESAHSSSDVGCLDCHSPHHAKEKEFLLVAGAASVVLRLSHFRQGRLRQTVSPPRQRGFGAMQRLPQSARNGNRAPATKPAER